jgi:CsoR family transcriptional regulator, copper-sensing transcriptional repressor
MRGYTINRDDFLLRLRRTEGQVRGLQCMIEADEYCIDVLTQVSSVTAALQSVAAGLVDEHLRHCVGQAATEATTKSATPSSPKRSTRSPGSCAADRHR